MKFPIVFCLAISGFLLWQGEGLCEEPAGQALPAEVSGTTSGSLRRAIENLQGTYGQEYTGAESFLKELDSLGESPTPQALSTLARKALASHPLLKKTPLLFVVRHQYQPDHHNTETLFQYGEINEDRYVPGGDIKTLDLETGEVKSLFSPGATGLARDPEVGFDGGKILFSCRKDRQDGYHIYEMDADGGNVRQLTSLPGISDIDPLYLPEGDIVFSSSRQPKFCMCNRHIMANLYRMEADGANPYPIGRSTLFEGHTSLLPDGRLLYDRWEYVDRNFGDAQGLWTVSPDGSNHAVYWGNNTASPGGVIDARVIPGTGKVIAVLAACHDRPWGALGIIDRQKGLDGPEPVERTWPADYRSRISTTEYGCDSPAHFVKERYEDPWPLDSRFFLVSRMIDPPTKGEKMGIFLVDVFGNEVLLYEDASSMGAYDPMPLAPRQKPQARPSTLDLKKKDGTFFLQNVYEGTHMEGVKPGEVKYLRIVESPEKRTWTRNGWGGQGEQAPAMNWHNFENKRVLGIVPVEEDGSAYFTVPADKYVFFQALDANGEMIQSMRSGTIIRPGEYQSCVGCHEDRLSSPPANMGTTLASRKAPFPMKGRNGKTELFSYAAEVQPIWDKRCLSCHDFGGKAAEKLNLAGDVIAPFNVSYTELWSKGLVSCVGGGPAEIRPARSWGAVKSRLMDVLESGHQKVKLTAKEMETIRTWIDLNAPYYPTYDAAYLDGVFGRGPLTPGDYEMLQKLCGNRLTKWHGDGGLPLVSFSRPEVSPILKQVGTEDAAAIRALLKKGQERLKEKPRADMPGFKPSEFCDMQLKKYDHLQKMEEKVQKARIEGKKVYDRDFVKK